VGKRSELTEGLEEFLQACPDAARLRELFGPEADEGPMTPEAFVSFARKLLEASRAVGQKKAKP
jgi:hypothetical protein